MSDQLRESVSAMVDGEIEELELRRLLKHADHDQVREAWSSYHKTQRTLRGEVRFASLDISAGVRASIDDSYGAEGNSKGRYGFLRPLGGFAVAASVAAVVVFGAGGVTTATVNVDALDGAQSTQVASRVFPASAPSQRGNMTVSARYVGEIPTSELKQVANAEAEKRLDRYMLRHTGQASKGAGQGMMAFARVATFEEK